MKTKIQTILRDMTKANWIMSSLWAATLLLLIAFVGVVSGLHFKTTASNGAYWSLKKEKLDKYQDETKYFVSNPMGGFDQASSVSLKAAETAQEGLHNAVQSWLPTTDELILQGITKIIKNKKIISALSSEVITQTTQDIYVKEDHNVIGVMQYKRIFEKGKKFSYPIVSTTKKLSLDPIKLEYSVVGDFGNKMSKKYDVDLIEFVKNLNAFIKAHNLNPANGHKINSKMLDEKVFNNLGNYFYIDKHIKGKLTNVATSAINAIAVMSLLFLLSLMSSTFITVFIKYKEQQGGK